MTINPFDLGAKRGLAERVEDHLQEMIVQKQIRPGDKLPSEKELSELMGVSRTALREGMQTLKARGVLTTRPGVGTVVTEIGWEQLASTLAWLVRVSQDEITFDDLHVVRQTLETEIASLAAQHADAEAKVHLKATMEQMRSSTSDPTAFAAADAAFHYAMAAMSGNPLLELLLRAIRTTLEDHIRTVVIFIDPEVDVVPYHKAILAAVETGDPDEARAAMRRHLDQVRVNYEQATSSSGTVRQR